MRCCSSPCWPREVHGVASASDEFRHLWALVGLVGLAGVPQWAHGQWWTEEGSSGVIRATTDSALVLLAVVASSLLGLSVIERPGVALPFSIELILLLALTLVVHSPGSPTSIFASGRFDWRWRPWHSGTLWSWSSSSGFRRTFSLPMPRAMKSSVGRSAIIAPVRVLLRGRSERGSFLVITTSAPCSTRAFG